MNKKEEKKIRRRFCHSSGYYTFDTLEQGMAFLEKRKVNFLTEQLIPCSVCGCYHLLHEYHDNMDDSRQYPNMAEREVLLNFLPMKSSYSSKRTKRKMIGRYKNVIRFPKRKLRFGTVPDDGSFYRIVSQRYICFSCRKSWRAFDRPADKRKATMENRVRHMSICPHCGETLQQVYPMFRAPKRNDIKAWTRLENRYKKKVK